MDGMPRKTPPTSLHLIPRNQFLNCRDMSISGVNPYLDFTKYKGSHRQDENYQSTSTSTSQTRSPITSYPLSPSNSQPLLNLRVPFSPSDKGDKGDKEPMSEITPYLFLGDEADSNNLIKLKENGISHILNVTVNQPFQEVTDPEMKNFFERRRIPALDNSKQILKPFFQEAFQFIDDARKAGKKVLVHCHAGISRSPTIAIGYLMWHENMSSTEAYNLVKEKRSIISPNLSFMGQLLELEMTIKRDRDVQVTCSPSSAILHLRTGDATSCNQSSPILSSPAPSPAAPSSLVTTALLHVESPIQSEPKAKSPVQSRNWNRDGEGSRESSPSSVSYFPPLVRCLP